jgi:hypothetical protein
MALTRLSYTVDNPDSGIPYLDPGSTLLESTVIAQTLSDDLSVRIQSQDYMTF